MGRVQGILFILVVGAATDYALLYVARYKEELTRHERTYQQSLPAGSAHSSQSAAGGTVIASYYACCYPTKFKQGAGASKRNRYSHGNLKALIPACTPYVVWACRFWPRIPKFIKESESEVYQPKEFGFALLHLLPSMRAQHGLLPALFFSSLLWLIFQLKADGVPQSDLILGTSSARDGQSIISDHFAGGSGTPAQIIASEAKKDEIIKSLDSTKGASVVIRADNSSSGTMPVGKSEAELKASIKESIAAGMSGQPNIPGMPSVDMIAQQAYPFKNATVKVVDDEVLIEATLSDSADSEAAQVTIVRLRDNLHEIDSSVRIGGVSAVQYDSKTPLTTTVCSNTCGAGRYHPHSHGAATINLSADSATWYNVTYLAQHLVSRHFSSITSGTSQVLTLSSTAWLHILGGTRNYYNIFLMTRVRKSR